jgi:photosystem II stability/assembly factor-like uncharacterized protein
MKNYRTIKFSLSKLVTLAICLLTYINATAQNWTSIEPSAYTDNDKVWFYDVSFYDDNNGIVVGYDLTNSPTEGIILSTTDGGASWKEKRFGSQRIYALDFFSEQNAIVVGTDADAYPGENFMANTTDGGDTWNDKTDFSNKGIFDIQFLDQNKGFMTSWGDEWGYSGVIQKTTDGGVTWSKVYITGERLPNICIVDENNGYLISQNTSNGNKKILKSTNGFTDCTEVYSGTSSIGTLYFINKDLGFALEGENVLRTTDGGANWTSIDFSPDRDDYGYSITFFPDNKTGFIISGYGDVFKTTDAGLTWTKETTATTERLIAIEYTNDYLYAVGKNGKIIKKHHGLSVGVERPIDSSIKVYPNPSTGSISIDGIDLNTITKFEVYDAFGKLIEKKDLLTDKDLKYTLPMINGVYLIQITDKNGSTFTKKVVKY